jgi:hypothetical protein
MLNDADASSSGACQIAACVEADITETLHDESLLEWQISMLFIQIKFNAINTFPPHPEFFRVMAK